VLDTANEERKPAREHEHLPVLGEGEAGVQKPDELRHPLLPLAAQVGGRHERVLAAQPFDGDRECVERRAVEVGPADALDQLERVVAPRVQEHWLGWAKERTGILRTEDRRGDRSERLGDEPLILRPGPMLAVLPVLPHAQQVPVGGERVICLRPQDLDGLLLRPTSGLTFGRQA
jgi:hypothetical protein